MTYYSKGEGKWDKVQRERGALPGVLSSGVLRDPPKVSFTREAP